MKKRLAQLAMLMAVWLLLPAMAQAANDDTTTGDVVVLTLTEPNTLRETLVEKEYSDIRSLTLKGPIGSDDLNCIFEGTMFTNLKKADLTDVTIVPDGGLYATTSATHYGGDLVKREKHYLSNREEIVEDDGTSGLGIGYRIQYCYTTDLSGVFCGKESLEELYMPNAVKAVGVSLCAGSTNLKKVSFPQGITKVRICAFKECTSLTSHNFGQLETIETHAFYNAPISKIDLSKCTSMDACAFTGSSLQEVDLTSLSIIPEEAFYGCKALKKATFSDALEEIYGWAFKDCTALTSVEGLPVNLGKVNATSFKNTPWFDNLAYEDGIKYINRVAMCASSSATSLNIKEGTTHIANDFECSNASNVTSLILPSTLRYIGEDALSGLSITGLTIPENVEYIGEDALANNDKATKINYNAIAAKNDNYHGIAGKACQKVVIGSKVHRIPERLFYSADNLTIVDFEERQEPAEKLSIGTNAFVGCELLKKFNGFQYVDSIEEGAFRMTGFVSLEIPENVKYLGEGAFSNTSKLTTLRYYAPTIGEGMFEESNVRDVTIGPAVRKMQKYAFAYSGINSVKFDERKEPIDSLSIGYDAFYNCLSMKEFDGWEYVDSLGYGAFNGVGLTSVTFPKGIRYVDSGSNHSGYTILGGSIRSIYYDNPLEDIGYIVATNAETLTVGKHAVKVSRILVDSLRTLTIEDREGNEGLEIDNLPNNKKLSQVNGWENIARIDALAFWKCGFKSLSLPSNITYIGSEAFSENDSLTTVYYDVPDAGGRDIFSDCKVKEVTIGEHVRVIPDNLFDGNDSLTVLTFENRKDARGEQYKAPGKAAAQQSLTIGKRAFAACTGLNGQELSLPDGTESVEEGAFYEVKLHSLSIPASVTSFVEEYPIYLSQINHAYIYAPEPPSWVMESTRIIYVLPGSVDAYKQDKQWSSTKQQILPMDDQHLPTDVKAVTVDMQDEQNATYYNMEGQRTNAPRGLTIVRYADGTTRKVMKKN